MCVFITGFVSIADSHDRLENLTNYVLIIYCCTTDYSNT